jgi:hypothetical protein
MDVQVIPTPPCVFHQQFSVQNIQGRGVRRTLTSTARFHLDHAFLPQHYAARPAPQHYWHTMLALGDAARGRALPLRLTPPHYCSLV